MQDKASLFIALLIFFLLYFFFFSVFWGLWKEVLCKRQLPSISTLSQLMAQSWLQVKLGYNVKFMGTLPFFMNGKIKEQVGAKSCQKQTADKRVKKGTWNIFLCTLTITISPSVISLLCITEYETESKYQRKRVHGQGWGVCAERREHKRLSFFENALPSTSVCLYFTRQNVYHRTQVLLW